MNHRAASRQIHDLIRGSKKKVRDVGKARATWLPPAIYPDVIAWILERDDLRRAIFPSLLPPSAKDLYRYTPLRETTLSRELRWVTALLSTQAAKLQVFMEVRDRVTVAIRQSDYGAADAALIEAESALGTSFWLAKLRLAVLQVGQSLEAQKHYVNALKRQVARRTGATAYILHYVSVRNEPSVTPQRFASQMRTQIANIPVGDDLRAFLRHHITGPELSRERAADVLRHSASASLVDGYEAFIHTARLIIATNSDDPVGPVLSASIAELSGVVSDRRLIALVARLDGDFPSEASELDAEDAWLRGDDESAEAEARAAMYAGDATLPNVWIAAATSRAPSADAQPNNAATFDKLAIDIAAVQQVTGDVTQAATNIARAALNFSGVDLFDLPHALTARALSPLPGTPPRPLPPTAEAELAAHEQALDYALCDKPVSSSLTIDWSPEEARAGYAHALLSRLGDGVRRDFVRAILDPADASSLSRIRPELQALLLADGAMRQAQFDAALKRARPLLETAPYYRSRAVRLVAYSLLRLNALAECVDVVASEYLRNENARHILPIRELADKLDRYVRRELAGRLSLAIVFDLYSRFVDGAYDQYRRRSYQDVLIATGVTRPSELIELSHQASSLEFQYFLRQLCVPEVMYVSPAIRGSRELQEERIRIVEYLLKFDESHRQEYEDEILARTRLLVLQARRLEAEQSRINVDLDGITREAETKYGEAYDRYCTFQSAGAQPERLQAVNEALSQVLAGDLAPLRALAVPADEVRDLLASLVRDLRDEFVDNNRFGLDGRLSTGIRHGTLANELRGPLLAAKLITQKDEATQQYRENTAWTLNASENSPGAIAVQDALAAFASDFDGLISEMLTDWVQVKREGGGRGLIDLRLTADQLRIIESLVSRGAPFDEFASIVFNGFCLPSLGEGLATIRSRIETTAKPRATVLLGRLLSAVEAQHTVEFVSLSNAIREAITTVQRAFDRVSSWFVLSKDVSSDPLPVEDGLQIALEIAQRVYPGFRASISLGSAGREQMDGSFLPGLLVIFLTAFENAVKKAGFSEPPEVSVRADKQEENLRFTLTNPIHESVDRIAAAERLEGILAAVRNAEYLTSVRREGRTGLHKIVKIIALDFLGEPDLRAEFVNDREFILEFSLPLRKGRVERE